MTKKKETYGVWASPDVGKVWDNIHEAEDVAEEAAKKNRCDMFIFKLVKVVEPQR